jgi:hypothetical protein
VDGAPAVRVIVAVRPIAAVLALIAVACMSLAIVGMVTGRPSDRTGVFLRIGAVVCFGGAVALTVASSH